MIINFLKLEFDSDALKLLSERVNLLSWALGGIGYLGFNLQGSSKAIVIICGWVSLQYFSFILFRLSKLQAKREAEHLPREVNNGVNKINRFKCGSCGFSSLHYAHCCKKCKT